MGACALRRGLRLSLLPRPLAFGEGHGRLGTSPGDRQGGGHRRPLLGCVIGKSMERRDDILLVGGLEQFLFFHILGRIVPFD